MEERPEERRTHQTPPPHIPGILVRDVAQGLDTPANQRSILSAHASWDTGLGGGPSSAPRPRWGPAGVGGRGDVDLSVGLVKNRLCSRGPQPSLRKGN